MHPLMVVVPPARTNPTRPAAWNVPVTSPSTMRSLIVAPLTLRKGGGALGFNIFDVDTERLPVAVEGALEGVLLRTYGGGDRRSAVVPCI